MSSRQEDLRHRLKLATEEIGEEDQAMAPPSNQSSAFNTLFVCAICGLGFGFALEKGRVFEPHIIREQMLFTNFTMLKMFLSAVATGMISFSMMSMLNFRLLDQVVNEYLLAIRHKTVPGAVIGGAILGAGMTIAGACPGMVLAQVGAGVPNSGFTLFGGLLGVLLYAFTDPFLPKSLKSQRPTERSTLDVETNTPYSNLALPFAATLGMVVAGTEILFPWYTQVELSGSGLIGSRAWPPFVAGALIGVLQLPIMLSTSDSLGSATAYVTVSSQLLAFRPLRQPLVYLKSYAKGLGNWWQVFYVGGAILGAYLSAQSSASLGTVPGVSPEAAVFGGVCMLYGSRLAGGCTSGHGLSGIGLLVLLSFFAVPAMFGGGIATAVIMKYGLGMDF